MPCKPVRSAMVKPKQIQHLAQRLRGASEAQDWAALAVIDQELAQWLRQAAPLTEAERLALKPLADAHEQARAACAAAAETLARRIEALQAGKDGWLAYALHSESDDANA